MDRVGRLRQRQGWYPDDETGKAENEPPERDGEEDRENCQRTELAGQPKRTKFAAVAAKGAPAPPFARALAF